MAKTPNEIKAQISSLINDANITTGREDTNLTDAVAHLTEGYGQGGIKEISSATEMTSLLTTAEVGSVVKYTGETTDTYESGALYIVEAVSE